MMKNKVFALFLLVAVLLSACAPAATPAPAPVATEPPAATVAPIVAPTEAPAPTAVPAPVELRFMYYADGPEATVMQPLIDKFQAANPDIVVKLDVVPYKTITDQLPVQAKAGQIPDMARITNFGAFQGMLLDLRPMLKDPAFMEKNFAAPVLAAMRPAGDTTGLYGFPDTLTVTGPFVNKTLFDQAGVTMPGAGATWDDWTTATKEVMAKTGVKYALTTDATGHRLASAVISSGATLLTADGKFTVDTPGFREFVTKLKDWHTQGLAPKEVWLSKAGTSCIALFKSGDLPFCLSGSWQVGGLAKDVGTKFDWVVVPTPTGAGGSVGIAGGSAVVGFSGTTHPKEVARFMEFLMAPENYSAFSAGTLALPAEAAVAAAGVEYKTDDAAVKAALGAFTSSIANINDQGWALNVNSNAFAYYQKSYARIAQFINGELNMDDMLKKLQEDIDTAIAQKP
jgi:alpha-1,4-digalacturonate transport system substrate-binding protein